MGLFADWLDAPGLPPCVDHRLGSCIDIDIPHLDLLLAARTQLGKGFDLGREGPHGLVHHPRIVGQPSRVVALCRCADIFMLASCEASIWSASVASSVDFGSRAATNDRATLLRL